MQTQKAPKILPSQHMTKKHAIGFMVTSYPAKTLPTKIKGYVSKKYKVIPRVRRIENSLDAAKKLVNMGYKDSVLVSQKQKQHFYAAARLYGFSITSRQSVRNTDKVRIWKLQA